MSVNFIHPSLFFFLLAIIVPVLGRKRYDFWKWLLPIPGILALLVALTVKPGTYTLGHYLGYTLTAHVSSLSLIFLNIFAIEAIIAMIFSMHVKNPWHHVAAATYVGGAIACVLSGDYLTLYIFWELIAVASAFLIWLNEDLDCAPVVAFRYLLFHIVSGLFLLAGIFLRYKYEGTFAFISADIHHLNLYDWLILISFAINAAIVPLHAWIHDAYPRSTVPGIVFMNAYTTKTAVFALATVFTGMHLLAVAGTVMTIFGAAMALIENNARKILTYHIISQVGYMVAGIGIGGALGLNGGIAHAYADILFKGLLFMAVGVIIYSTGRRKLTEMGGLAYKLPWVMIFYMIGALSISGAPLFAAYVTKTMVIAGAAEEHMKLLALGLEVAAVGTFLSVGLKLPYFAFFHKKEFDGEVKKPIPKNMYVGMAMAAFMCILVGSYPHFLYKMLPIQPVEYHPYTAYHILSTLQLLGFTGLGFYLLRKIVKPHDKIILDLQYLYYDFTKWLMMVFANTVATVDSFWSTVYKKVGVAFLIWAANFTSIFDRGVIDGIVDGSAKSIENGGTILSKLQTGKLNDYIEYAVAFGFAIILILYFILH
ncbi:Na(+)/H(+) antiporter subunit D [Desulfurobacterium sp.]